MAHEMLTAALEHMRGGGWIMVPLGGVSVAQWYLVLRAAMRCAVQNRHVRPLATCLDGGNMAPWQRAMLSGFRNGRTGDEELDRRLLDALAAHELECEGRRVQTILLLAGLAPLLGLLGTVGGMIDTFDTILQCGTGNARGLASGISSALITTQTGLIVAVPGLLAGCVLRRRVAKLRERALGFGLALMGLPRMGETVGENNTVAGVEQRACASACAPAGALDVPQGPRCGASHDRTRRERGSVATGEALP